MQLVRTTLRLKPHLKKTAERLALEKDATLQEIFNEALSEYLDNVGSRKAKQIVFRTHDLGISLDHMRRGDYYRKLV